MAVIIGLYGTVGWDPEDDWLHSAGASLFVDGKHAYTISEERLSRIKHDGRYPQLSIDYVLNAASLVPEDVDHVVYANNLHSIERREDIATILSREFEEAEVSFVDHHQAHAEAAFLSSPFEEASILSFDGAGNRFPTRYQQMHGYETGFYALGDTITRQPITIIHHAINGIYPQLELDLGQIYNNISRWCYTQLEPDKAEALEDDVHIFMETAPGKIMGLAGYGDADKVDLPSLFGLMPEPNFPVIINHHVPTEKQLSAYEAKDVAAWLQKQFETALSDFFIHLPISLKRPYLCLAGGCGLNVLANRLLIDEELFKDIFVFPATNDSGLCYGAAISKAWRCEGEIELPDNVALLGKEYTEEEIRKVITNG